MFEGLAGLLLLLPLGAASAAAAIALLGGRQARQRGR